ncbi:hypothetical protein [Allorhodopirellula solitaria]|uniref:Uncharacterized protein n=1 Tax=Allorhodopirellula solitaria TaxID=2527987 RepID=A0A5C5YIP4_9BACT|nr:hypothetical protein [Allorhodopirellula solitaria]TWT74748.1 hypothetical protein CA85_00330 [Allorhodopirellula solitaria]
MARCIAVCVFITAGFGLFYNLPPPDSLLSVSEGGPIDPPYFRFAYFLMAAICVCFYCALIYQSTCLWKGFPGAARAITRIFVAEVAYFFLIPMLWIVPVVREGVGPAMGIANGGLMAQFLIFLPLWAPLLFRAFGLYDAQQPPQTESHEETESPAETATG